MAAQLKVRQAKRHTISRKVYFTPFQVNLCVTFVTRRFFGRNNLLCCSDSHCARLAWLIESHKA